MAVLCFLLLTTLPVGRATQITEDQGEYRIARPGYRFRFPADHGSHPEYKLEWWYITGHLAASDRPFGYELTFFRIGMDERPQNPSRWTIDHLYAAHFALTDVAGKRFRYFEKVNRAGPGIAGAAVDTLSVWNENWSIQLDGSMMRLHASAEDIRLELELSPRKEPVVHGTDGVSQKASEPGRASHYYSMTRLRTAGTLIYKGDVLSVAGTSWMDHEFGTNQLAPNQAGWDWFSLQLDGGLELMLYRLRLRDGSVDPNSSGTAVFRAGDSVHLTAGEFMITAARRWTSQATGVTYPLDWRVRVPSLGIDLRVVPLVDGQELVTIRSTGIAYWEGAVRAEGTWKGNRSTGHGYVELTGYSEEHRPDL